MFSGSPCGPPRDQPRRGENEGITMTFHRLPKDRELLLLMGVNPYDQTILRRIWTPLRARLIAQRLLWPAMVSVLGMVAMGVMA